jgi:hypothetical protein
MLSTQAGGSTGAKGDQTLWAYTRNVLSWPKRLTSVAMVVALSGSPAVLSSCMALCFEAAPIAAMAHKHDAPAGQTAPAPTAAVMPAGHAHHGAATTPAAADTRSSAPASSTAHLGTTCNSCCPDGVAVLAGPGAERTNSHACGAAPMVPVARFLVTPSVFGAVPPGPPVSPPAPFKAPLVLRV